MPRFGHTGDRMVEKETIVVLEFRGKVDVELRFGPIIPLSIAWRLFDLPRATVKSWVERRRLTKIVVTGQTFVSQQEVLAEIERRKNDSK